MIIEEINQLIQSFMGVAPYAVSLYDGKVSVYFDQFVDKREVATLVSNHFSVDQIEVHIKG